MISGGSRPCFAHAAGFSSFCDFSFFFYPKWGREGGGGGCRPYRAPSLDPLLHWGEGEDWLFQLKFKHLFRALPMMIFHEWSLSVLSKLKTRFFFQNNFSSTIKKWLTAVFDERNGHFTFCEQKVLQLTSNEIVLTWKEKVVYDVYC